MNTNNNKKISERDVKNYLPTFKRYPLAFKKGLGSRLWDVNGKEYIDALAGIAVNNVGHCHPHVVEAIRKQAGELMHISNFFVSEPQVNLADKLIALSGMDRAFFTNSGAESVEGAIKIARKYAHNKGRGGHIISMQNSFHGRTLATIATGKKQYQKGFEPIPEGFGMVPFNDFEAVKTAITKETAAVLLEPIQGEGGIHPVQKEYLQKLHKLCSENDVLLIFDEIQCGIGRTGKMFAKDLYGIEPDIITLAKGLGGGFPIGAFLCNEKVASEIDFGDHGTTFGGNPLACSAALATLEVIEKEKLLNSATEKGKLITDSFKKMQQQFPEIKEIRGRGLMIGVEFTFETKELISDLLHEGIIANATSGNVLRLVPPLNISNEDIHQIVNTIEKLLAEKKYQ
ncbi:MAG: aspartate aminotransferase family protein [Chitinophagaceae bacterium]|nr:MAG: aspartate aminotransferase family protein [Chitinophagaceae bacterium]